MSSGPASTRWFWSQKSLERAVRIGFMMCHRPAYCLPAKGAAMDINAFFEQPILNSPYAYPSRHWELDAEGQPTQRIIESRRRASYITPIPKPKKRKGRNQGQEEMLLDEGAGLSTIEQQYEITASQINAVRNEVDQWRQIPEPNDWHVTPESARLLQHWRHHSFQSIRPFFAQVEAVEVAIWLVTVLMQLHDRAEEEANGLVRCSRFRSTSAETRIPEPQSPQAPHSPTRRPVTRTRP